MQGFPDRSARSDGGLLRGHLKGSLRGRLEPAWAHHMGLSQPVGQVAPALGQAVLLSSGSSLATASASAASALFRSSAVGASPIMSCKWPAPS